MTTGVHQGDALREVREACGVSAGHLARLTGVSRQAVSKWEHSERLNPSIVARALRAIRNSDEWARMCEGPRVSRETVERFRAALG